MVKRFFYLCSRSSRIFKLREYEKNNYICNMKQLVHYIISYLGAALFCCGILGCIFKWIGLFLFKDSIIYFQITYSLAIILGLYITFTCYHPRSLKN